MCATMVLLLSEDYVYSSGFWKSISTASVFVPYPTLPTCTGQAKSTIMCICITTVLFNMHVFNTHKLEGKNNNLYYYSC